MIIVLTRLLDACMHKHATACLIAQKDSGECCLGNPELFLFLWADKYESAAMLACRKGYNDAFFGYGSCKCMYR